MTRSVRHPTFRPELAPFDRLRSLRGVRRAVLVRGVRVLDLLAPVRPAQILQAVVRRVVVYVVDSVLVVPLWEAEGDRHEHVDEVVFAVDSDLNVALLTGLGVKMTPLEDLKRPREETCGLVVVLVALTIFGLFLWLN